MNAPARPLAPPEKRPASRGSRQAVILDQRRGDATPRRGRQAVFLDRDGVLNFRKWNLVRKLDELRLIPRAVEAAARFSRAGFVVAIATNQEFVGSGYIKREDHDEVMQHIVDAVADAGGRIDGVYACLHPRGSDCYDQKPKPGMLHDAARDLDIDLQSSIMVGDNRKDLLAGRAAGCRTVLLDPRFRTWWQRARPHADHVVPHLDAAAPWILGQRTVSVTPSVPVPIQGAPAAESDAKARPGEVGKQRE